jgi:hypothetical protein
LKVKHIELSSSAKNTGGETAIERLSDRESLRMLPFIQRMILEKKRRSEADHQTIPIYSAQQALICLFDQLLMIAHEIEDRAAQKDSASEAWTDGAGDSDDA